MGFHDHDGNTALHVLLQSQLLRLQGRRLSNPRHPERCLDLQEILTILIIAGADVYTANNNDKTPTILASENGLTDIWTEALEYCGFDSEAVIAHSFLQDPDPDFVRQYSKVAFEEYCQRREAGFGRFEEIQDSDTDTDEGESDEDTETDMDEYAEEDMDQRTEDEFRAGSEVGGGQDSYDHFEFYTQDHNAMEFDTMEQPAEGWTQKDFEGIGEGVNLGFNLDGIYGNEFMQQEMNELVDLDA
jgi:hypothetical protein